jgi:hypothetical protein
MANLTPDASANLLATIMPGLELVFDTTALALALSVLLMLGMFLCDQVESRLLVAVDSRVNRELIGRFKGGATLKSVPGAPGNMSDGFMGALEKLMQRQTEMFQASMESANKQWEERTEILKQQLESGQGGGGGNRGGGGGGGGMPMAAMSGDAGQFQEALMRSASFAAAQQAEMAIQNEIMQQLAEVIGQGSANWPVRRSRLCKPTTDSAVGEFETDWAENA